MAHYAYVNPYTNQVEKVLVNKITRYSAVTIDFVKIVLNKFDYFFCSNFLDRKQ